MLLTTSHYATVYNAKQMAVRPSVYLKVARSAGELCHRNCQLFEGKTFEIKNYCNAINNIRYAGVTIHHPDTNDFGLF
jgi:hypothetical protein